jgi:hypothetical protein
MTQKRHWRSPLLGSDQAVYQRRFGRARTVDMNVALSTYRSLDCSPQEAGGRGAPGWPGRRLDRETSAGTNPVAVYASMRTSPSVPSARCGDRVET